MSLAVISDVHGNLDALEAVMADISRRRGIREVFFLGDAVGYGPEPNECVSILVGEAKILLAGNHDWAAVGLTDIDYFNPAAKAAILWTAGALTPESKSAIEGSFALVKRLKKFGGLFLVHASPVEPGEWHYVLTLEDARLNFAHFAERICLLGHSHAPFVVETLPPGDVAVRRDEPVRFSPGGRYIINAGSVGQPRDGDPRACYAVLDEEEVRFVRVPYDIGATQKKMREAGLPAALIERLSRGR